MKKIIVKRKKQNTVVVIPRKSDLLKNLSENQGFEVGLVNFITGLMEKDYIEQSLSLVNLFFEKLTLEEKGQLALNIIEATKQYDIPVDMLPESYYDFLASDNSNSLFF